MLFFEMLIYGFLGLSGGYLFWKLICFVVIIVKALINNNLASQGKIGSGFNQTSLAADSSLSHLNFNPNCQFNGGNINNTGNTYYPNCNYDCGICINNLSCMWYQDVYLDDIDFNSCGQNDCIHNNHCGHGLHGDNYNCDMDNDGVPDYLDDDF